MTHQLDSPTNVTNHPHWTTITTRCQNCDELIREYRPRRGWRRLGKRVECYICLGRWWHEVLKVKNA